MPYPNEHSCRLTSPGRFKRFARDNDKDPNVIYGVKADGKSEIQAYRYPKSSWSAARARSHCEKQGGSFEAARGDTEDKLGLQIRNVADDIEFLIYGVIGGGAKDDPSAKDVVAKLNATKMAKTITVSINSPGGDVFDGVAIYNALKAHPARVVVNVDGMAGSVASIIAMAGEEIRVAENAMMMLHDPVAIYLQRAVADELRKKADVLDKLAEVIVATYASRTGIAPDEIRRMMGEETWLNAEEAVRLGFADTIVAAKKLVAFAELADYAKVPKQWLAQVLAEKQEAEATARRKEAIDMADEDKTLDVAELRKEGAMAETERFRMLDEAFDDKAFVAEMFREGTELDKARGIYDQRRAESLAADLVAKAETIESLEKQLAEMKSQVESFEAKAAAKENDEDSEDDAVPFKSSDGDLDREAIIAKARRRFVDESKKRFVLCSEAAWINDCLLEADVGPLRTDEVAKYGIADVA